MRGATTRRFGGLRPIGGRSARLNFRNDEGGGGATIPAAFTVGMWDIYALGPELLENGAFLTSANWALGAGWSIAGQSLQASGTSGFANNNQPLIVIDKTYHVEFDFVKTAGSGTCTLGGVNFPETLIGSKRYAGNVKAISTSGIFFSGLGMTCSIDNVTIKEIL